MWNGHAEKSGEGEGESGEKWSDRGWNSHVEQTVYSSGKKMY